MTSPRTFKERTSEETVARHAVAEAGLALTKTGAEMLDEISQSVIVVTRNAEGYPEKIAAITEEGETTILEWITALRQSNPAWFAEAGSPVAGAPHIPANATLTERMRLQIAHERGVDRKREKAQELVENHGNPWKTGNFSHQMYLGLNAPDLVGRLKLEAQK